MNLTVALTGASGSIFGQRLLHALERDARVTHVNFIASENSLRVMAEELHLRGRSELVENSWVRPPPRCSNSQRAISALDLRAAAIPLPA